MHDGELRPAGWLGPGRPAEQLHHGQGPTHVRQIRHLLLHRRRGMGNHQNLCRPAFNQKGMLAGVAGRLFGKDLLAMKRPHSAVVSCQIALAGVRDVLSEPDSSGGRLGGGGCTRGPGDRLGGWTRRRTGLASR